MKMLFCLLIFTCLIITTNKPCTDVQNGCVGYFLGFNLPKLPFVNL